MPEAGAAMAQTTARAMSQGAAPCLSPSEQRAVREDEADETARAALKLYSVHYFEPGKTFSDSSKEITVLLWAENKELALAVFKKGTSLTRTEPKGRVGQSRM